MERRIRLTFPSVNASAEVVLREDVAPETCAALWDRLPLFATAHHAVYSGSEGVLILPELVTPKPENATSDVATGDVGFAWFAPGDAYGVDAPFAEICWFYDSDGKPSMPEGPVPVSVFGRIDPPADAFYHATRRMRREGVLGMSVEKVEPVGECTHVLVHRPAHGYAFGPRVGRLSGGGVVVVFNHSPDGTGPGPRCLPFLTRSTDGGLTWNEPAPLEAFGHVGHTVQSLSVDGDGTLRVRLESYAGAGRRNLASLDGGRSWSDCAPTPTEEVHADVRWEGNRPARLVCSERFCRTLATAGPGPVDAIPLDAATQLIVYAAWDGFADAPVPGVCGIHATRWRPS